MLQFVILVPGGYRPGMLPNILQQAFWSKMSTVLKLRNAALGDKGVKKIEGLENVEGS